jgi:hypothetical protein
MPWHCVHTNPAHWIRFAQILAQIIDQSRHIGYADPHVRIDMAFLASKQRDTPHQGTILSF